MAPPPTKISLHFLLVYATLTLVCTFTSPVSHVSTKSGATSRAEFTANVARNNGVVAWHQKMALEDGIDEGTSRSRKRRKRKDRKEFSPSSSALSSVSDEVDTAATPTKPQEAFAIVTPKQNLVSMQVRDIRDVISGFPKTSGGYEEEDNGEELADDEEWEYYDAEEDVEEIISLYERAGGREQNASIERLLADARRMRSNSNIDGYTQVLNKEEESSTKDAVFDIISTIVTVDFFVVIGLLIWFLAGIFCSALLGNDSVQISFNMNFERVTQPALGILMIGSVAGALGNKDNEE